VTLPNSSDSPVCTTYSSPNVTLEQSTTTLGITTAGTWSMPGNTMTYTTLGTAKAGTYTGTIQYTITG